MSVLISSLPVYTGSASDLRWYIMNNSGETQTFKFSGYSSQLIPGTGSNSYRTPNATASGNNGLAIGYNAVSSGNNSIAIGSNSNGTSYPNVTGANSIGIGSSAQSIGPNILSIGIETNIQATNTGVVVGHNSQIYNNGVVVGNSCSSQSESIVIGNDSRGFGYRNINIGHSIGFNTGTESIAIGSGKSILNVGDYEMMIGGKSTTLTGTGNHQMLIGGDTNDINGTSYFSLIINGSGNTTTGNFNSIIGSQNSSITGGFNNATIGGSNNTSSGYYGGMLGGSGNSQAGNAGAVIGGYGNNSYSYCGLMGGYGNNNFAEIGFIHGNQNRVEGQTTGIIAAEQSKIYSSGYASKHSFIGGGYFNVMTDSPRTTIFGGQSNTITNSTDSSIIGGTGNTMSGKTNVVMVGTSGRTAETNYTTYVENIHIYRTPSTQVQPVSSGTTFTCNLDNGAKSQFYLTGTSTINITNVRDGASFIIKTQTDGNYTTTWTASGYTFVFEGGIKDPGNTTIDLFVFEVFGSVIYGNRRHNYS